jgi:monoamine oxidase
VPAEERDGWTSLTVQKDNLERFLRQLGECDPELERLARENLNFDSKGNVLNSYENKNWWRDEFTRGAFVFYNPNQETYANGGFSGVEKFAEPIFTDETETTETNILDRTFHFAGSSTNYDWNGWMEGAVVSGQDAATQIISVFMDKGYSTNII